MTYDHGFIVLAAADPDHGGIAYCHARKYSIGEMIQVLRILHERYTRDDLVGRLVFL